MVVSGGCVSAAWRERGAGGWLPAPCPHARVACTAPSVRHVLPRAVCGTTSSVHATRPATPCVGRTGRTGRRRSRPHATWACTPLHCTTSRTCHCLRVLAATLHCRLRVRDDRHGAGHGSGQSPACSPPPPQLPALSAACLIRSTTTTTTAPLPRRGLRKRAWQGGPAGLQSKAAALSLAGGNLH